MNLSPTPPSSSGPQPRRSSRRIGEAVFSLLVGVGLLVIVLLALWPWPIDMWSVTTTGDGGVATWNYWWGAESAAHLWNPWWTGYLFAPVGTFLVGHGLLLLPALIASPLTWLVGAALAVNVTFPIWVAAAGVGAYVLCRRLGTERLAALLAGAGYALAPAMLYRVPGHLGLVAGLALFPFVLAVALQYARTKSWRWAIVLGFSVAALLYTDALAAAYVVPAVVLCTAISFARAGRWRSLQGWLQLALVAGVVTVLVVPQFLTTARVGERGEDYSIPHSTLAVSLATYPTDPVDIVLPSPASRYLASVAHSARDGWNDAGWAADGVVAPGLLLLILAAIGAIVARGQMRTRWLLAWVVGAWALALGPIFRFAGQRHIPFPITVDGVEMSAIMPATWFAHVPVLGDLRVPQRFALLALLPLALLSAMAAQSILRRIRSRRLAASLVLLATGVFALEGARSIDANLPLANEPITAPIAADPSTSVVADVPLNWQSGISSLGRTGSAGPAMTRATQHGHPISSGYISRVNQERIAELARQPFYALLLERQSAAVASPLPDGAKWVARRNALAMNVRWAVVWPEAGPAAIPYLRQIGFHVVRRSQGCTLLHLGPLPTGSAAAVRSMGR